MGEDVTSTTFTRADRTRYRQKVRHSLDVFARMLARPAFDTSRQTIGCEIELNLVDADGDPAMRNEEVLARSPTRTSRPSSASSTSRSTCRRGCRGNGLADFEHQLRPASTAPTAGRAGIGAHLMMIGILPTLQPDAPVARQPLRQPALPAAQRADLRGARRGHPASPSTGRSGCRPWPTRSRPRRPAPACSSTCRSAPEYFADYWNAAQAIAGVQVALGRELAVPVRPASCGRETRIALFEQATDTRPDELKEQGVRPRVWFGERWITSIFDLFEENVRYFPALLPICDDEDPAAVLAPAGCRGWRELRLHNGTVYRWNRPVYDVVNGQPHLRVENRVLPAGPTVADMLANAAFYFGLVRALPRRSVRCGRSCRSARPRRTSTPPPGAASTPRCSGRGSARCRWPSWCWAAAAAGRRGPAPVGRRPGVARPAARASSSSAASTGQNGAAWQARAVTAAEACRAGPDRRAAADVQAVHRSALQRTGAHLAGGSAPRSCSTTARPHATWRSLAAARPCVLFDGRSPPRDLGLLVGRDRLLGWLAALCGRRRQRGHGRQAPGRSPVQARSTSTETRPIRRSPRTARSGRRRTVRRGRRPSRGVATKYAAATRTARPRRIATPTRLSSRGRRPCGRGPDHRAATATAACPVPTGCAARARPR